MQHTESVPMIAPWRVALIAGTVMAWIGPGVAVPSSAQSPPPPQIVPLQTRDGVQLKATYYPSKQPKGTPQAKQVTPVVLLHDWKETRAIFAPLAERLQNPAEEEPERPSFAVVTVDLRAHGDSTQQVFPNGSQLDLDAAKLGKDDFIAMATLDMEAVRGLLVVKNDAGELNLNKLCLLGAGMGANVAANWAAQDWAAPPLAIGKQGQDVKALVLVSPRWSFNGLTMQAPLRLRPLKQSLAWMLIYGDEDRSVNADVVRINRQLERFHPKSEGPNAKPPRDFAVIGLKSRLQGGTLISKIGLPIEDQIIAFLAENVARKDHSWQTRLNLLP
jgi:pimeloyl-ACP methyl ester carboxylesterase